MGFFKKNVCQVSTTFAKCRKRHGVALITNVIQVLLLQAAEKKINVHVFEDDGKKSNMILGSSHCRDVLPQICFNNTDFL